ncbi:MAG: branched-chain amino acid ABC transporter permease, partial [Halanaeroarchaeum sp.]
VVEGMVYLARYFSGLTGGAIGKSVTATPWLGDIMGNKMLVFYLFFVLFVAAILITIWIRYSKLGYYLLAIREDQDAAAALGVNTTRYKIYGFVLSAAMTAIAGSLHAVYITYVSPAAAFSLNLSILYALVWERLPVPSSERCSWFRFNSTSPRFWVVIWDRSPT